MAQVLGARGLSLRAARRARSLPSPNSARPTRLKAIHGPSRMPLSPASGSIRLGDVELTRLKPHEGPRAGVAYVPQAGGCLRK